MTSVSLGVPLYRLRSNCRTVVCTTFCPRGLDSFVSHANRSAWAKKEFCPPYKLSLLLCGFDGIGEFQSAFVEASADYCCFAAGGDYGDIDRLDERFCSLEIRA